ncbi:hypothetical protein GDO78_012598, partial [Eleutherodactylus coqui]
EAVRLFADITEKLNEAEKFCKQLLKTEWEGCKACLEWSCIKFYTNSCSQLDLQTFVVELSQKESLFSQMMSDVSTLFNQSVAFLKNFHNGFNDSFQNYFLSNFNKLDINTSTMMPERDPVVISDYFEHWDFSGLLQSLYEFGQSVFETMTDVFILMYKKFSESPVHLRALPSKILCNELQNASECLLFQKRCQLCYESVMKDCPDVIELHLKTETAFKLVNVSRQQYEDVVQLLQQHTDETYNLVSQMKGEFGWVTEDTNITSGMDTIFNIER